MQDVLAFERRPLLVEDRDRPVALEREALRTEHVRRQRVTIGEETAVVAANRAVAGMIAPEQADYGFEPETHGPRIGLERFRGLKKRHNRRLRCAGEGACLTLAR